MKIYLSIVWSLILLLGCAKEASSDSRNKLPELIPVTVNKKEAEAKPFPVCQVTGPEKPFSCLEEKCRAARGKYDSVTQHCDCGEGYSFNGWNAGKCEFAESLGEQISKNDFSLSIKGKDFSVYQIKLSEFSVQAQSEMARKFMAGLDFLMQQGTLPQQSYINLLYGPGSLAQLSPSKMHKLHMEPNVKLRGSHDDDSLDKYYYLFVGDEPAKLFKPNSGNILVEHLDTTKLNSLEKSTYLFLAAMSQYERNNEKAILYTADGCSSHCEMKQLGTRNDVRYERTRRILGGQFYSDSFELYNSSKSQVSARVELFPNGQVSLIHLFERGSSGAIPVTTWTVYDRYFRQVYQKNHEHKAITDFATWKRVLDRASSSTKERPEVVVCESGFNLETIAFLTPDLIVKGPLSSSNPADSQSLFGWVNSSNTSPLKGQWIDSLRTSGVSPMGNHGLPSSGEKLEEHAKIVAHIVSGRDRSAGIIPIGLDECFYQPEKWVDTVRTSSQARVINISAYESKESIACENSVLANQIRESVKDFLFVVGAGNAGLNNEDEKLGICPQALAGRKNLLVVASSVNETIATISNRGRNFADLAADGSHYDVQKAQTYATSYATPKVSHVASLISQKFPELSPAQLRLSLLLGAKIPYSYYYGYEPMFVRAGGILDEVYAEKIAEVIAHNSGISTENLLKQIYCRSVAENCAEAMIHLKLAKAGNFTLEGIKQ